MREKLIDLGMGILEKRVYDSDDKLVEIRKVYPSSHYVTPIKSVQFKARGGREK